jgi:O-antigen ligase
MAAAGALSLPILAARWREVVSLRFGLVWFGMLYLAFVFMGFLRGSYSEVSQQALRTATLYVCFLWTTAIVFSSPHAARSGRYAVVFVVFFASLLNFFELAFPGSFSDIPWRAAGFHANPNGSAIALVLGMLVGFPALPARMREGMVMLVGAAVLATLSRAGILVFLLAVGGMLFLRQLSAMRLLLWSIAVAITLFGALLFFEERLHFAFEAIFDQPDTLDRLEWLLAGEQDFSAGERAEFASAAWELFNAHVWLGAGLGATQEWDYRSGPHNMYLMLAAEHGILGLLVMPALALAVLWGARGKGLRAPLLLAIVVLAWSFFDHNVLDNPVILLVLALTSAASAQRTGAAPDRTSLRGIK